MTELTVEYRVTRWFRLIDRPLKRLLLAAAWLCLIDADRACRVYAAIAMAGSRWRIGDGRWRRCD